MRMLSKLQRLLHKHYNNNASKCVSADQKLDLDPSLKGHADTCPGVKVVEKRGLDKCVTASLCTGALLSEGSDSSTTSDSTCKVKLGDVFVV